MMSTLTMLLEGKNAIHTNFGGKYGTKNAKVGEQVQEGTPHFYFTTSGKYAYFRAGPPVFPHPLLLHFFAICPAIILAPKLVSISFSLRPEEVLLVLTSQKLVCIISLFQYCLDICSNYIIIQ